MPRLPTIRVIGSQDMFTSCWAICHLKLKPFRTRYPKISSTSRFAPLGFAIQGSLREAAQGTHGAAIHDDGGRGQLGAGRLIRERHELVGEARHGAADADAADVGT